MEGASPPAQVPAAVDPNAPPQPPQPAAATPLTVTDIKFPEGFTVADDVRDSFLATMNNAELTPAARAQALVDIQAKMASDWAASQEKAWVDAQEAWATEVRNDKDIGGDKLAPALGQISQLIDKYGSPELREVFTVTNAGNNIHMVKFLANIAKDFGEGGPVSGAPAQPEVALANKLFPSMK